MQYKQVFRRSQGIQVLRRTHRTQVSCNADYLMQSTHVHRDIQVKVRFGYPKEQQLQYTYNKRTKAQTTFYPNN
jgi:hypothetical protein